MISKRIIMALLVVALTTAVVLFSSCYPDYGLGISDYDMVLTGFDKNTDFGIFQTYAMPDTVLHPVPEGEKDDLSRDYDALIISRVVENMAKLGYTRITDPTQPFDVLILLSALKSDWEVYNYYPGYWWGWYPGYPGGPWYPWYPGYGTSYKFTTGTLFITMVDPENFDPDNNAVTTLWGALLNGLVDGDTPSGVRQRIQSGINEAFAISPYLKTN
jgi:hypothetical protein